MVLMVLREMKIYNTQQKFLEDFTKNTFNYLMFSRLLQALVKSKCILEISIITGLFFVIGVFIYLESTLIDTTFRLVY